MVRPKNPLDTRGVELNEKPKNRGNLFVFFQEFYHKNSKYSSFGEDPEFSGYSVPILKILKIFFGQIFLPKE